MPELNNPQARKPVRRVSAAEMARGAIEKAEQDGIDRGQMILRMTLRDASELKRDPSVALADISFGGGAMRYLGVRVEQGGVTLSTLDRGDGEAPPAAAAAEPAPKKKPAKKKAKAPAE
ncbi:MAG: hypothetical protein ACJ798_01120 [Phenylobacterium sp.]